MRIGPSHISLNRVRLRGHHGVLGQEYAVGGDFIVTLSARCDISRAAESDSLEDAVDYGGLLGVIEREMERPSRLLEHLAGRIARGVLEEFGQVEEVRLTVEKANPPLGAEMDGASVTLVATRDRG